MAEDGDKNPGTGEQGGQPKEDAKTFTQEDIDKMITARLAKARSQWEKELAERKEKEDAEHLEGEAKIKKMHELEINNLVKERDELSHNLAIANAKALLSSKKLDPSFAEMVIGATPEDTEKNITNLEKLVTEQVNNKVKEGLSKGAPPAADDPNKADPIRDQIRAGFGLH